MAARLALAGFDLTVWNRTQATARAWTSKHAARVVSTPAEVAAASDIVIAMVVDGDQVEAVLLGETGAIDGAHDDSLFIDMSTIGPSASRRIASTLEERGGIHFMDAPVTGSSPKAEDGTLTIMAGGEQADFERARPLFESIGELIVHAGPVGDGQMIKLINNSVAAINTAVAGEALLLGSRTGVDLDALVTVIGAGSGGSAMLDLKQAPMRTHDYATLFKLEHMQKDVRLCLDEAQAAGGGMESAKRALALLERANELGFGEHDFTALIEALEAEQGQRL